MWRPSSPTSALSYGSPPSASWCWRMSRAPAAGSSSAGKCGFERTLQQYSAYYFIGMYFSLLLPTSVGGDVMRVWYLERQIGRKWAALASVFLERLNGLLVLIAVACVGVLFAPSESARLDARQRLGRSRRAPSRRHAADSTAAALVDGSRSAAPANGTMVWNSEHIPKMMGGRRSCRSSCSSRAW